MMPALWSGPVKRLMKYSESKALLGPSIMLPPLRSQSEHHM